MPNQATNYINHVALVLDASSSMTHLRTALTRVADEQIKYLAQRSTELDQETRVSIYVFSHASQIRCLVFDKDVLRLPSIASLYRPEGMTALIDATLQAQEDLARTAQMYGDHAFLTYVLTDGMENASRSGPRELGKLLAGQPENWTTAVLVPDRKGRQHAIQCGFPEGNIEEWDASSERGLEDSFAKIRTATDSYMTQRAAGVRGTRSLFAGDHTAVNHTALRSAGLKPLDPSEYKILPVVGDATIRDFVEAQTGRPYVPGSAYYQLTKVEPKVQAGKAVVIRSKKQGKVYAGAAARGLLGLPDHEVRLRPADNPEYDIFIQSTSVNRRLVRGTTLIVLA